MGNVTFDRIKVAREIAEAIQPCPVRAIAYKFFIRKLINSMDVKEVRKVGAALTAAREHGLIPWGWIVDKNREDEVVPTWANMRSRLRSALASYRRNKWQDQPVQVLVWSEKGTVGGTLEPVLDRYEVPFLVLHGWSGATPIHAAAQDSLVRGKPTVILYVGDYDPSGMYMSEVDLPRRLYRYSTDTPAEDKDIDPSVARIALAELGLTIRRIALTQEDTVALGKKLAFKAEDKKGDENKKGDSRYEWFVRHYGHWCWELDALDPNVLRGRVASAILGYLDSEAWDRYVAIEELEIESFHHYFDVIANILDQDPK
jgi:hypothetical protein